MLNYYLKYLKYKTKYYTLTTKTITDDTFAHSCFIDGYKQYFTECWNDSIQTILTFTEPFKELQKKALIKKSDGTFWNAKNIITEAFKNKKNLLPLHLINENDKEIFENSLKSYIDRLLLRFKNLYYIHNTGKPTHEGDKALSITCALNAITFSEINKKNKLSSNRNVHFSNDHTEILSLHSLSFVLLPNNEFLNFDLYGNTVFYKPIDSIVSNAQKYFALQLGTYNHTFNVYMCPENKLYFYDNENKTSIEFDWVNYFNKNIKFNEYILKDIPSSDQWKFYLVICKDSLFYCDPTCKPIVYNSRLCYYNESTNELLVLDKTINEYKIFNYIDITSKDYVSTEIKEGDIQGYLCDEILSIFGLFISTAATTDDYKSQLEHLNYFLYNNNYDLPDVMTFILNKISWENIDEASEIIYNAFILEHSELIKQFYKNKRIFQEKKYYFNSAFINLKQYETFIKQFKLETDYKFICDVIITNKNIAIEVLQINYIKNDFKDYFNLDFNDIFYKLTDYNNPNLELIKYLIKNNICDIISRKFTIDTNKVNVFYYLAWSFVDRNPLILTNFFDYLLKNWNSMYTILNSINTNGNSILYEILCIKDTNNFINIINIFYKIHTTKIHVFNMNFLYYDISNLTQESLVALKTIIDKLNIFTTRTSTELIDKIIIKQKTYKRYYNNNDPEIAIINDFINFLNTKKIQKYSRS